MPTPSFPHLKEVVELAAEGLPGVEAKRLFGCDGFFARGTIFSLIWKTGRIGVKLLDEADYAALMKVKGSSPWSPGPAKPKMSGWILVGPSLANPDALAPWIKKAHAQALAKPKAPAKKKAAKKKIARRA